MNAQRVQLVDKDGRSLADAHVVDEGAHYGGTIDLSATPADVRALFDLFDELVNTQQFTCADEIEAKIDALAVMAKFGNGCNAPLRDLQVYPSTGDVSFKLVDAATRNGTAVPACSSQPSLTVIENPWHRLPENPPFVLPEDKKMVEAFEDRCPPEPFRLCLDIIPEPFLGNKDAPVVLLGNISTVTGDQVTEGETLSEKLHPAFMTRMRENLQGHTPFPYFDPGFSVSGQRWWGRKLKHLLDTFGRDILSQTISTVEFFPYVSHKLYRHDRLSLPSQEYSRFLVRNAMKQDSVIVLRKGESRWFGAVPELERYHGLVRLIQVRKDFISPGNCRADGYQKIVRKIEATLPKCAG